MSDRDMWIRESASWLNNDKLQALIEEHEEWVVVLKLVQEERRLLALQGPTLYSAGPSNVYIEPPEDRPWTATGYQPGAQA